MKNKLLLVSLAGVFCALTASAQYYEDDIYYNPKKDSQSKVQTQTSKNNYIEDMANMDVDQYNRRGQYYTTPVDTIGSQVAEAEDFAYTRQLQRFYNPTIILENADQLEEVINDSYGNVNIIIEDGVPCFDTWYSYSNCGYYNPWYCGSACYPYYGYPYYGYTWGYPGWSWSWTWGPSYAWWGPGYWGPSYWGPGYWGPSWNRPVWSGPVANVRPHRPGTVAPNSGWTHNTRPSVGNTRPHRGTSVSGTSRPVNSRPNSSANGTIINNGGHRSSQSTVNSRVGSTTRNSSVGTSGGHRSSESNSNRSYNSNSNRSYNSNGSGSFNSGSHRSSGSFGGSGGGSRSSGGSFGGSRGGGGGRGGHR